MTTPLDGPDRPNGYYDQSQYGNQGGQQEAIEMQEYPQQYPQEQYPGEQYPPPDDQYPPQNAAYPHEPPPEYTQGNGQPAPISVRADRPRPAGVPTPGMAVPSDPVPEQSKVPLEMTCPHCNNYMTTRVEYKVGKSARRGALYLLIGCCIPCALIPLCMQSMRDVAHYCTQCNKHLGTWVKPNEVRLRPGDKVQKRRRGNTY